MNASLSAPLRIQRRTGHQLRHAPYLERTTRDLLTGARGELGELEVERLGVLAATLWRSPYYREALQRRHLSPSDLRTFADLPHFPTLDRATLAEHWRELPALDAENSSSDALVVVQSSGTTGTPARVMRSEAECLYMWAALRFWVQQLGLTLPARPRVALLDALPSGLTYSVRLPILDRGALHRLSLVQPGALDRLAALDPAVLFTDPAGLHALLGAATVPSPKLILTSAQYFAPSERARLAERMSAPVINYYATTETGPIAWECLERSGVFHTLHPEVWVESIDGALAVTRLRPSPLPLLRYLTGDSGQMDDGQCECGFVGRSIAQLEGRAHCEFIAPDGQRHDAWQLAWVFKVVGMVEPPGSLGPNSALLAFEFCQLSAERFLLTCSTPPGLALHPRLEQALLRLGWRSPVIDLVLAPLPSRAKPTPFTRTYQPCC